MNTSNQTPVGIRRLLAMAIGGIGIVQFVLFSDYWMSHYIHGLALVSIIVILLLFLITGKFRIVQSSAENQDTSTDRASDTRTEIGSRPS